MIGQYLYCIVVKVVHDLTKFFIYILAICRTSRQSIQFFLYFFCIQYPPVGNPLARAAVPYFVQDMKEQSQQPRLSFSFEFFLNLLNTRLCILPGNGNISFRCLGILIEVFCEMPFDEGKEFLQCRIDH